MSVGTKMRAAVLGTAIAGMAAGGFANAEPKQEQLRTCTNEVTTRLMRPVIDGLNEKRAAIAEAIEAKSEESVRVSVQVKVDSAGTANAVNALASSKKATKDVTKIADIDLSSVRFEAGNACKGRVSVVVTGN